MSKTWVSEYYKNLFGTKVYKLTFDAGCTCPTRDGSKGTRGCIFCSQSGSGEFTVPFDMAGVDFALTALFAVLTIDQIQKFVKERKVEHADI